MKRTFIPHTLSLLVLVLLLFTSCAGEAPSSTTVATTTAATTIDRDALTLSGLSDQQKALYQCAWEAVKDTAPEDCTIDNLSFGNFVVQCDEAFICFYYGCSKDGIYTSAPAFTTQTIAGYEFEYGSTTQLTVFANGKKYNLQTAYDAGVLTEEDIRTIWDAYNN